MKKQKFYIKVGRTLISTDGLPEICKSIPDNKSLVAHFDACKTMGKYVPVMTESTKEVFDKMLSEVSKKSGQKVSGKSIPIILDSATKPIVVITYKEEEKHAQ